MRKESTLWGKFVSEKKILIKKIVKKIVKIMGSPILAKLPTPLVLFCPILLDPPNPP